MIATSLTIGASPAAAVPEPTTSGANNNAPMGFLASNGQAPNPASFCESPDYFDFWNQNPNSSTADGPWTTDTGPGEFGGGITATLVENSERVEQRSASWGVRFGGGGRGTVTLSEPVFYSQWVVSDMDIRNEGFVATATLGGAAAPVTAVAAFGANATHDVTATQPNVGRVVRTASGNVRPWDFVARSQIDFLGPVDTVVWDKLGGSGALAGFLPSMGCAAVGSAKEVSSPATWDPATQTFSTQYTIRVRSNMPNAATIEAVLTNAAATLPAAALPSGLPEIPILDLSIVDSLVVPGASVQSVATSSPSGLAAGLNPDYDGVTITELVQPGFSLSPETTETVVLDVVYTPDFDDPSWADGCHSWTNQAEISGSAASADIGDRTDEGDDPRAAELNGDDSVDTPTTTEVCLTPEIDVTKTLDGTPVVNSDGTIEVSYDLEVANEGNVDLEDVSLTDDLVATFGAGSSFSSISTAATGPCAGATNAGFDGVSTLELLADDVTIPATGTTSCTITISFTVDPGNPALLSPGTNYVNATTASSQTGQLPLVDDTDTVAFNGSLPAEPLWTIEKTTDSAPTEPGQTLDYTFTIVNTGNTSISMVEVTDDKCAADPTLVSESMTADAELEIGETQEWTCTSIPVTADEVDAGSVDNEVTASGAPAQGDLDPVSDVLSVPIAPTPAWTIVKANTSMANKAGDTIDYEFTIVNTGNVTITALDVVDDKCDGGPTLVSESVASNAALDYDETQVWRCTSVPVTQAEADAGIALNTVTVSGTPAGGTLDPVSDDHSVPITADPSMSVVKAATTVPGAAGESITYAFTLVNTGNVTISAVDVADPKCATTPALDTETITTNGLLDVGETQIWSCTSVPVTQAEVDAGVVLNEVTVTGTPTGGDLDPAVDDHATPISADPSWTMVKAATTTPSRPGDTITYTFTVVNTGNVTISDVSIADDKCASTPELGSESITPNGLLDPGESQAWSCTSVAVTPAEADAGNVRNVATVTGSLPSGDIPPASDTVDTPIEPAPDWTIGKTSTSVPTEAGQAIDYTFSLVNTGNVTISSIVLTDAKCDGGPTLDSESVAANGRLDFGETQIWKCTSQPVTQIEIDAGVVLNDVVATGTPAGGMLDAAADDHAVPITPNPSWAVVKANTSLPTEAGDTITYAFTLVNTGNVTISNVAVADAKCALPGAMLDTESLIANGVLDPGETQTWICTSVPVTQPEADAGVVNNDVSVTGTPAGGSLGAATDTHQTPLAAEPSWDVTKAATTVPTNPGDTIGYSFAVVNTGNVTISGVAVTDSKCAAPGPVLATESLVTNGVLDPGETQIWNCTSLPISDVEVDAGVVLNSVTVTGTPAGGTLPPATDDHETPVTPAPSWAIVKSTSSAPTEADETINYTFTLINTGNVSISSVALTDDKCAAGPTLSTESVTANGILDYDETQVWICTSDPVLQSEVDAGIVQNEVTATGTSAGGSLDPVSDEHNLPIAPLPAWSITKASTSSITIAGERLAYSFTVVNSGNVTINSVALTDNKCDGAPAIVSESITTDAALEVGETQIWACTSVPVSQAEVDEGEVNNEVAATGTPAGGDLDPIGDTHTVSIDPNPALVVAKATSTIPTVEGETLSYTFTVINTGNVTITDVTVVDEKCATMPVLDSESVVTNGSLEFGETQIWSCTSDPISQDDVDAGVVSNSVTVDGTPAGGSLDPVTDDLDTPITRSPSWAVVKSTDSAPTQVDDTLVYRFTVINTGNVTITDVAVTDAKCAADPVLVSETVASNRDLDFDETQVWSCASVPVTQPEVDAGIVPNTVDVVGTPAGGTLAPADADLRTPIIARPAWNVIKAATSTAAMAGETVDYAFTLTNTGNVTVDNISVVDTKCATEPMLESESVLSNAVLEFGETQIWTCTSQPLTQTEVDAGQATNTVNIAGDPAGGSLIPATDVHVLPIDAAPSWQVVKAASNTPSQPGQTIDYSFTVVNTGNVTITDVSVTDPKCAADPTLDTETVTANGGVLEFGETQIWSCTSVPVTAAEVDAGLVENTVTVAGDPAGGTLSPATDDHDIPIAAIPGWSLNKAATSTPTAAGQTVHYEFSVINTGNVTIADIVLTDGKCASGPTLIDESQISNMRLDFAETQTWTCTSVPVPQADVDAGQVDNTASATGTPALGALPPVEATNSVPIDPAPAWTIVKAAATAPGEAGDTIDYRFTLVNTGNVGIGALALADPKCATPPLLVTESLSDDLRLEPGEAQTWACTSVPVTQAEVDAGIVDNEISATGVPAGGVLPAASDTHRVAITAAPAWDLVKSTSSEPLAPGDTLLYSFTVINSGNVTVNDVQLTDAKCASDPALDFESLVSDGTLQFGETQIWSCTSVAITQADVDAGEVLNDVSASGTPEGGTLPDATNNHRVAIPRSPSWTLSKTTDSIPQRIGATLDYTFVVTNTGNVTIRQVEVLDAKCASGPTFVDGDIDSDDELDVGEAWTYECESIPVTSREIGLRQVLNDATARGVGPTGLTVPSVAATSVVVVDPSPVPARGPAPEPVPEVESVPTTEPLPAVVPIGQVPAQTELAHTGQSRSMLVLLALWVVGGGFHLLGLSRRRRRELS